MTQTPRTALITGASSGIGAAFAKAYAKQGCHLVLAARNQQRLQTLADELADQYGTETLVLKTDLAEPAAAGQLYENVKAHGKMVDILVNNAGYGINTPFLAVDWQTQKDFLTVLAISVCELSHRFGQDMRTRKYGRIIQVASLAAFFPGTYGFTLYGAIKSLLVHHAQSMNMEGKPDNIHVCALCPGFTHTEFQARAGIESIRNTIPEIFWMSAEDVAKAGIRAVEKGKPVHIPGLINKCLAGLGTYIPDSLLLKMAPSEYAPAKTDKDK